MKQPAVFSKSMFILLACCAVVGAGVTMTSEAHAEASASTATAVSAPSAPQDTESKHRARLDELFIWKASEDLKLSPADEQKFTDFLHKLTSRRRAATDQLDDAVKSLNQAKTKAAAEKALAQHRKVIREMQSLTNSELDQLRTLLGPEKLARYIVIKSELTDRLKALLSAPGAMLAPSASPSH